MTKKWIVGVGGVLHIVAGLLLIAAPTWFYTFIGHFPPYNRHYMGDAGAFTLALGVGLLLASRNPARQRLLIGIIGLGGLLHGANHAFDSISGHQSLAHWLIDTVPLAGYGVLLLLLAINVKGEEVRHESHST